MKLRKIIPCLLPLLLFCSQITMAQMQRQRAVSDRPVEEIFLTSRIAGLETVTMLGKNDLNFMIMHNFGEISSGIEDFYGIDQGANVRLAFDYGLSDKLSIGVARTSVEDNVDFTAKYAVLRQMESDKVPVTIVFRGNMGITTEKAYDLSFVERLNYLGALMIARKFEDKFSLQITPMVAHFNTVFPGANEKLYNTSAGLGLGGRIKLDERKSITFEYLPVLFNKNDDVVSHAAIGYEIETGGHVFQMFLMSGRMFTEQHLLAQNEIDFFAADFRLGFNINRVFGLGK